MSTATTDASSPDRRVMMRPLYRRYKDVKMALQQAERNMGASMQSSVLSLSRNMGSSISMNPSPLEQVCAGC